MPCVDCQRRDAIIAELTASLEKRDQQLSEANAKLAKQKLQSKAKFAQLKHQVLENVAEKEGPEHQKILENLLTKLDETENQLSSCREEIDSLKDLLAKQEKEISGKNETISHLEQMQSTSRFSTQATRARSETDVTSEEEDLGSEDLRLRIEQMYAQIVYKDSKIVELSDAIVRRDEKILDLQESCRERDEVIWAKTKAVQVFQDKLNFYANRDYRDVATETVGLSRGELDQDAAGGPGRAVAFYGNDSARGKDEDESSVTTEAKIDQSNSVLEKFNELAESVRYAIGALPEPTKSVSTAQLSAMLQHVELLQSRLVTMESRQRELPKKKREKKVTFDFTSEQERAEVTSLKEKLSQADQACFDLREENDDLRLTISDLEQQLSLYASQLAGVESNNDLQHQLHSATKRVEDLAHQLRDKDDRLTDAEHHVESLSAFIRDLEHQLEGWQQTFAQKEAENFAIIKNLERRLHEAEVEIAKLMQQKEMILSDVDDLRDAIEASQQVVGSLENDLQTANNELDNARTVIENLRREHADMVATLQRDLTTQRLNAKAYEAKLRGAERENERLVKLSEAQKEEWILLRSEGKEEVTGFRLKAKAYEAKFRILQDDNERLENLVSELKSAVDALHNEKAELTKEYDRKLSEFEQEAKENLVLIERAMSEQKTEIETLKAELSSESRLKTRAYEAKWRSIERENERMNESVGELKRIIEGNEEENKRLSNELALSKEKLGRDSIDKQGAHDEINVLKAALEKSEKNEFASKAIVEKLQATLSSKDAEYSAAIDDLSEAQSSVRSLRTRLDSSSSHLHQAKDQIRLLTDEKQDLEADLRRLWDVEANLKRRLGELETSTSQLREENANLLDRCSIAEKEEQKLENLSSSYDRLVQENGKLKEKLEFLEAASSDHSRLANELQQWKDAATNLERDKAKLEQGLGDLRQREADLVEDKTRLESLHSVLADEVSTAKASYEAAAEEIFELQSSLQATLDKCNDLQTALGESSAENNLNTQKLVEIIDLQSALQTANEEKLALLEALQKQKLETAALDDSLNQKLGELQLKAKEKEEELSKLRLEKTTLEDQLNAACEEVLSSNLRLESLQQEKEALEIQTKDFDRHAAVFEERLASTNVSAVAAANDAPLEEAGEGKIEGELLELKAQYLGLLDEKELMQGRLQLAEELLTKKEEEAQQQLRSLEAKDQTMAALKEENQRFLDRFNEFESERQRLGEERHGLCAEIVELNAKLSMNDLFSQTLKQDVEVLAEENDFLKATIAKGGKEDEENAKMDSIAELEQKNHELRESYQQLAAYYNELQSAYAAIFGQYQVLQQKPAAEDVGTETDSPMSTKVATDIGVGTEEPRSESNEPPSRDATPDQSRSTLVKLKAKLRKMEKTMEALESKNKYLQEKNSSLETKVSEYEKTATSASGEEGLVDIDLENEVQTKGHELEPAIVQSGLKNGSDQLSMSPEAPVDVETERKIAVAMSEAHGLRQHISVLVGQLEGQKAKYDELQQRFSKLESEKSHFKSKFDDANETLELLHQEMAGVKQLFQATDSEKQTLQARVNELSAREIELKQQLAERTNAFASLQTAATESTASIKTELDELSTLNGALKEELGKAVNDRERAQEKMRRLLASTDELEIANHELNEKLSILEKRCAELDVLPSIREENVQLKNRMHDVLSMLQNWERQVAALEEANEKLVSDNANLVETKAEAEKRLKDSTSTLEKLRDEVGQATEDNTFLRSIVDELEEKNRQLQDEISGWTAKYQEMESLQELVGYHKELEQRFHEETEKCDAAEKKLQDLTVDWQRLKDSEAASASRILVLDKQCEDLQLVLHQLQASKETKEISTSTDLAMGDLELVQQELESAVERLTLENQNSARDKEDAERRLGDLQSQLDELQGLESQAKDLRLANGSLVMEKEQLSGRCDQLASRFQECRNELALSAKREEALERDVESLTLSLESLTAESKTIEEESTSTIVRLKSQIELFEASRRDHESMEAAIASQRKEAEEIRAQQQKELDERLVALSMAKEEFFKARTDCDAVRTLYESLYAAYAQLENANQILVEEANSSKVEANAKEADWSREEEKLLAAIEDLKSTNDGLVSDLAGVKSELDSLRGRVSSDRQTMDKMINEIELVRKSIEELESIKKELTLELERKTKMADDLESQNERLVLEFKESQTRSGRLTADLARRNEIAGDLEMENERLVAESEQNGRALEQLKTSLRSAVDQNSHFLAAFSTLGLDVRSLDDVQRCLENLVQERDSFTRQRSELVSKAEAIQVKASNFEQEKKKCDEAASQNQRLQMEVDDLKRRIATASETHEDQLREAERKALEAATGQWQKNMTDLCSKWKFAAGTSLEENLDRLGSRVLELDSLKTSLENELRLWKDKHDAATKEERIAKEKCGKLQNELDSWRKRYLNLENDLSMKADYYSTLDNELKAEKERKDHEQEQWRMTSEELMDVKRKLSRAEQEIKEKITECADLASKLDGLNRVESAKTQELEEAAAKKSRIIFLQQQLSQAAEEKIELESRIETGDAEIKQLRKHLERANLEIEAFHEQLETQRVETAKLKAELDSILMEKSHLVQRLDVQKQENADIRNRWDDQNSKVELCQEQLEILSRENVSLRASLDAQRLELDNAKEYGERLLENLNARNVECVQVNERLVQLAEEARRGRLENEAQQQQAFEVAIAQLTGAKDLEFRQESARLQNDFSSELARSQEELTRAVREKQEAIQWLDQERPKYVSSIRSLGELKEQLAQQQRHLDSAYLKLAELEVAKEKIRELETAQERTKLEKKELAIQCDNLRQDIEDLQKQLAVERNELESVRNSQEAFQKSPTFNRSGDSGTNPGEPAMVAANAENENLREQLKAIANRNSSLLARIRELEYQQTQWSRRSPSAEQFVDLESGSEHGDTVSLMPMDTSSRSRGQDRSLQLRRETLGSLSADRSIVKSLQFWLKSKARKFPYLTRRRPNTLKLLLMVYALAIHVFVFICWIH